MLHLEHSFLWC